ncbi:unnamed protein product [Chrysoparadoxa australica]
MPPPPPAAAAAMSAEVPHELARLGRRVKTIPLRCSEDERELLQVLLGAMNISDYTAKVDISSYGGRLKIKWEELRLVNRALLGLAFSTPGGEQKWITKRAQNHSRRDQEVAFLQRVFEVGRRYKVMNPEKMRSEYGKLMYLLQDAASPELKEQLGYSCVEPMHTVAHLLEACHGEVILRDPDLVIATRPIMACREGGKYRKKTAEDLRDEAMKKSQAIERLMARHGHGERGGMKREGVKRVIESIADANAYIGISVEPIKQVIGILKLLYSPDRPTIVKAKAGKDSYQSSLAIKAGGGHRLSHSHREQYYYVLQSLILWKEVVESMLEFWSAGEKDLLDPRSPHSLRNTGQGMNRVQGADRVGKLMRECQRRISNSTGYDWVGSCVVHLGDHCVPNAMMFLDKYAQVPRILAPLARVDDFLMEMEAGKHPNEKRYVDKQFGSPYHLRFRIFRDFFTYAFNGSGARIPCHSLITTLIVLAAHF